MYFNILQDLIHQNENYLEFSISTEIPEWFSHQNVGSSLRMPLPLDLHDNNSWIGIALFIVVIVHKKLNRQDYNFFFKFTCISDMVKGLVDRHLLGAVDISGFEQERFCLATSCGIKLLVQAGQLRHCLKERCWISTLITSNSPYVQIKMCGAREFTCKIWKSLYRLKARSSKDPNATLIRWNLLDCVRSSPISSLNFIFLYLCLSLSHTTQTCALNIL